MVVCRVVQENWAHANEVSTYIERNNKVAVSLICIREVSWVPETPKILACNHRLSGIATLGIVTYKTTGYLVFGMQSK